jgi:CRP-like cAMP-binding protein
MSPQTRLSTKNQILTALPQEDYERLESHLEQVELAQNQVLYHANELITHIYFPNNATASVVATTPHGQSAEVSVIGREGVFGVDALMGADSTPNESVIRFADSALCIKTNVVREEFKKGEVLQDLLLRFSHALMLQTSQTSLCHRLHSIEERLACRLLLYHDRSESDHLPLTYELLSLALGTSPSNLRNAAITLQSEQLIVYFREQTTILDRKGLENFVCDCYRVINQEYDYF